MSSNKIVGDYEIIRKLGKGSFADVYEAIHTTNKVTFAIKKIDKGRMIKIDERLIESLRSEIEIMGKHPHPNIVKLHHHFEIVEKNHLFLVLEFCPGGDLHYYLQSKKDKKLDEQCAVRFLVQLAEGLEFLHNLNIIHRDIKPQNVLLTDRSDQPVLKLADFGFAKVLADADAMAKTHCGTPLYM